MGRAAGVFFYLNTLKAGDRIQLTGQDGAVYAYKVVWAKLADATRPPTPDIVGPTKTPSLTPITCGGPWDAGASEYTQRTVVRAQLVSITPPRTQDLSHSGVVPPMVGTATDSAWKLRNRPTCPGGSCFIRQASIPEAKSQRSPPPCALR